MTKLLHGVFRRAALDYAAHGWPIFPLKPGGRMALEANGAAAATTNVLQIEQWWSHWPAANIGLDCGRAGVVAIELNTGQGGMTTWAALNLSARTSTCRSSTGFVLIYAMPVGHKPMHSNGGALGPGVTVRAAGEHVVLPPSVLKHGGAVPWLEFSDGWRPARTLMVLPRSVLALLLPVPYERVRVPGRAQRAAGAELSAAGTLRAKVIIAAGGRKDRSRASRGVEAGRLGPIDGERHGSAANKGGWFRGRAVRKIH